MDDRDGATRDAQSFVSVARRFFVGFFIAFILEMHAIASVENPVRIVETTSFFESNGRKITAEIYTPATREKFVGILLLHGAGGIFMDGPAMRRFARALAENGFETFVAHYFERTGNLYARDTAIHKNFDNWRATVNDAVNYLKARSEITAIGLFGYSLGGYLSLAQAAHDPRVGAVVEQAGAIPKDHVAFVKRLPPLLILHGDKDRHVPVENAYVLEKVVQRLGVSYEKKIYPGEAHVLSIASQRDAADRAVRFFQQHLR
jgi:dipeptidyl aminopeptidase/acylaminoacyl peptidase